MVIANTWFKQHPRRLWTWATAAGRVKNQIDYICKSQRYRDGLLSAKTYPGADCGSDHVPVITTLRTKMKPIKKPQTRESFDREMLCSKKELTVKYRGHCRESAEKDNEKPLALKDTCILYKTFRETVSKALKENIPKQVGEKQHREWITDETKDLFYKKCRNAKGKTNYQY